MPGLDNIPDASASTDEPTEPRRIAENINFWGASPDQSRRPRISDYAERLERQETRSASRYRETTESPYSQDGSLTAK